MVDLREFRFEFPCPSCQARLRLKDRSLVGTRWNCPECKTSLEIQDAGHGDLTARIPESSPQRVAARKHTGFSPRTATALVAITLITGVAVLVLRKSDPPPTPLTKTEVENPSPAKASAPTEVQPPPAQIDPVHERLTALGAWLDNQHEKNGAFPSAVNPGNLPLEDRLGWLALFREETEPNASVHGDPRHSWRDPANEAFVRRRAPALLNPHVTAVASDDGYPASHFVGVAGVGADAEELPKSHPRAGVFGIDRRTTREDITDGTSNTLMVMGVQGHPPAWAHGTGSQRGLTAEPYVGGPDQFGTGQTDGMQVLMADGSVRFLSSQTDPKLMRRMAAMADGLPLDVMVPGEPDDRPVTPLAPVLSNNPSPQGQPANDTLATEPVTVEITPESVGYDVERGLSVAVAKYHLETPVPLRSLLREFVEMSALPIDFTGVKSDSQLDQLITLDLQKTTLKEILTAALGQAQLGYTADAQGIHLHDAAATTGSIPTDSDKPTSEPAP